MIDAGYNYERLAEKMAWPGIAPQSIRHILITHQDNKPFSPLPETLQRHTRLSRDPRQRSCAVRSPVRR